MIEDILVLLAVFACLYPIFLIVEWLRRSAEEEVKRSLKK